MSEFPPTYLGDGAYAKIDRGQICIYTSDGIDETNHVYLELPAFEKLKWWVERAVDYYNPPIYGKSPAEDIRVDPAVPGADQTVIHDTDEVPF